jgi:hypothetical protein
MLAHLCALEQHCWRVVLQQSRLLLLMLFVRACLTMPAPDHSCHGARLNRHALLLSCKHTVLLLCCHEHQLYLARSIIYLPGRACCPAASFGPPTRVSLSAVWLCIGCGGLEWQGTLQQTRYVICHLVATTHAHDHLVMGCPTLKPPHRPITLSPPGHQLCCIAQGFAQSKHLVTNLHILPTSTQYTSSGGCA